MVVADKRPILKHEWSSFLLQTLGEADSALGFPLNLVNDNCLHKQKSCWVGDISSEPKESIRGELYFGYILDVTVVTGQRTGKIKLDIYRIEVRLSGEFPMTYLPFPEAGHQSSFNSMR